MTQANTGPAYWKTAVSAIRPDDVMIRGFPMSRLVGHLPFSAIAYLLIRGELPTPGASPRFSTTAFRSPGRLRRARSFPLIRR